MIRIPDEMVILWEYEKSITILVNSTFPNLYVNAFNEKYKIIRALITLLNENVEILNQVINIFPSDRHRYYYFDSVEDDIRNLYRLNI